MGFIKKHFLLCPSGLYNRFLMQTSGSNVSIQIWPSTAHLYSKSLLCQLLDGCLRSREKFVLIFVWVFQIWWFCDFLCLNWPSLSIKLKIQLGKLRGAELKLDELILARSGRSLAQIRASLQAVAKMAVVDYLWNIWRQNAYKAPEQGSSSLHAKRL